MLRVDLNEFRSDIEKIIDHFYDDECEDYLDNFFDQVDSSGSWHIFQLLRRIREAMTGERDPLDYHEEERSGATDAPRP